jgi:hypothetical protein
MTPDTRRGLLRSLHVLDQAQAKLLDIAAELKAQAERDEPFPPSCIHTNGAGLCPDCQAEYDSDPMAYVEYGEHPEGRENWRALQEEIARTPPAPLPDPDLPF